MNTNVDQSNVGKFFRLFSKIELALAAIAMIGLVVKFASLPAGGVILVLSLSSLSILYFFSAQVPETAEETKMPEVLRKISALSSSIPCIGILFIIQGWPGFRIMLMIGCASLVVAAVWLGILHFTSRVRIKHTFLRVLLITLLGITLYLIPKVKLQEFNICPDHLKTDLENE